MTSKPTVPCAIYTRKSSEEGLDQSFNSLHAQREACEAFIASQKHEGWHALKTHYDDGGFSGGSMERPALKQLLKDISDGKISTVVVYKVDRLTRSLADFAKIIEAFDAKHVSFVSVTQQFNTTTSMGRLTLNVLLSFAQFEREVTGERIRDKIAASKQKGMWMGGFVPLGYDVKDRHLFVNPEEAETVREIFRQYLRLGTVSALRTYLLQNGIRSKVRPNGSGMAKGGATLSRGALYHILNRRLYLGEIAHRGNIYPGQHEPIIDRATWEKVAALLTGNNNGKRRRGRSQTPSLLTGILFDASGHRYTPTHAVKNGKRYRYYTSRAAISGSERSTLSRIPAYAIENVVQSRVRSLLCSPAELSSILVETGSPAARLRDAIDCGRKLTAHADEFRQLLLASLRRAVLEERSVSLEISAGALVVALFGMSAQGSSARKSENRIVRIDCDFEPGRWANELRLVVPGETASGSNEPQSLLKAIARSRLWYERIVAGEIYSIEQLAAAYALTPRYASRILRLALIPPLVVQTIIEGGHSGLSLGLLTRQMSSIKWNNPTIGS